MTKRQTLAACEALAPDFQMRAERHAGDVVLVARFSRNGVTQTLTCLVGAEGRAAVESRLLTASLAQMHPALSSCGAS